MNQTAEQTALHWGPLTIGSTVLTTWLIMAIFMLLALLASLRVRQSQSKLQNAIEAILLTIEAAIAEVVPPTHVREVLPFVASLWLFVLLANLIGLIPGLHAPTRDLSATAALAVLVFFSTHWYGIRTHGLARHLRHYCQPSVILLPFHVISEITRTLALAIRLFGNIMSLEMAALLVLLIAGFLVPVPLLLLHVVEAVIQAYIFGMLALIYIASALESVAAETANEEAS